MDTFLDLVQQQGLAIALLIVAVITVVRGDWVPKKSHESTITLLKEAHIEIIKTMQDSFAAQLERLERANEDWRRIAVHGLDAAEEATLVGKELASKAGRR